MSRDSVGLLVGAGVHEQQAENHLQSTGSP